MSIDTAPTLLRHYSDTSDTSDTQTHQGSIIAKEAVATQSQNLQHIQQTTRFTYASIYTCSHVAAAARPRPWTATCTTLAAAPSTALSWLTDRRPDRRAATAQRGPAQRGPPSEASKLAKTAAGPALIDCVIYLDTMLQRQII